MKSRANYPQLAPEAFQALTGFEKAVRATSIEGRIVDLVKLRASQLNGCLFCVDMHSKEARLHDERELRLHHLPLWRESPLYSERERAALEWTERLTRLSEHGISDDDYAQVAAHFSEKEIGELTFVVVSINAWNRLGVAFRTPPGSLDKLYGLDKLRLG
jgi:AhpD family alkylhydroperoxidase